MAFHAIARAGLRLTIWGKLGSWFSHAASRTLYACSVAHREQVSSMRRRTRTWLSKRRWLMALRTSAGFRGGIHKSSPIFVHEPVEFRNTSATEDPKRAVGDRCQLCDRDSRAQHLYSHLGEGLRNPIRWERWGDSRHEPWLGDAGKSNARDFLIFPEVCARAGARDDLGSPFLRG